MNKFDIILCIIILIIGLSIYGIFKINSGNSKEAIIYYENKEVLKIDLSDKTLRTYNVAGYNGNVVIETVDGKVRVINEISPKHLCSKQGYISNSYESIICLPNKIVIQISNQTNLDAVVN